MLLQEAHYITVPFKACRGARLCLILKKWSFLRTVEGHMHAALDSTASFNPRSLTAADSRWNFLRLASSKGSLLLCERLWGLNRRKNIKWGAERPQRTALPIKAKEHKYKRLMISLTVCKKIQVASLSYHQCFPHWLRSHHKLKQTWIKTGFKGSLTVGHKG